MKKVIKIFLASSITEFAAERNELEVFIRNMSDIYEEQYDIKIKPVRCEQIDPYITDSRTQDIINASLDECELCFVLVYTRFGEFSYEEFRHALNKFRESAEHLPKIYVYFKQLGDGESADESVVRFMNELNDSLKHYYGVFKNIDTVKLRIALNFVMQKLDISSVALDEGRVSINGVAMDGLDLSNVSEFYNSRELTELKNSLLAIEKEYYPLHAAFKKGAIAEGDSDFEKYSNLASERAGLKAEIERIESDIFNMSVRRSKDEVEGYISERHKAAYQLFEQGDLEGANEVLDEDEIENDYKARKAKIIAKKMEELRQNAIVYIREMKTKIDILLMIKDESGYCHNYGKVINLYEKIIPEALENLACLDVIHDYGKLVIDHWQNSYGYGREEALTQCLDTELELLDIYEDNEMTSSEDIGLLHALIGRTHFALEGADSEDSRHVKEALSHLYEAEEILTPLAVRSPDKFNEHIRLVFNTIGKIHEHKRDFIKAEQYYVKPTRIYLSSGRRLNEKVKRALAENYLGMDSAITVEKALELYEELYQSNPAYTDKLAACYRAKANILYRNLPRITTYPTPTPPDLELAISLMGKAIELQNEIAADNAIDSYLTVANDYSTLVSYHHLKLGPFEENPDKEQALIDRVAYLEKAYNLLSSESKKLNVAKDILEVYTRLCCGENHTVCNDPDFSYGCTNDREKRKYYNELWKQWAKEERRLEGNTDLSTGIDDHSPSLTPDEADEIRRTKAAEEKAREQAKINEAKSPTWGNFTTDISFETIEEGIACYIGYLNGNSMYFYLLKDLIEDNKDTLSPDVMIDTALNLLKELCQQHEVCADYAIELAEYCVTRDSSLISKLEQVYYNAKNHYCEIDGEKRKKCFPDHLIEFLESLAPDRKIEDKLLSLYSKEIDDAITWSPRNQVEIVEGFTLKSIAILEKREMDIVTARSMASQLEMMSQILRISGKTDDAVAALDKVVAIFSAFIGTDDEQSALLGIANTNLSRCLLYSKIENLEKAAEALDSALTARKTIYENGYKGEKSAERFKSPYEKYKDVLATMDKDKLTAHLKDYLEYTCYLYERRNSDYYTDEYIESFDMAISLLESADHPAGVVEIAEIKLEHMHTLVQRMGRKYIDNVKSTLQKLIHFGEIIGETEKLTAWKEELASLTA